MRQENRTKLKKMVLTAMLGALSGVLMLFQVKVPFMPPFYSLDLGDLPGLFGGFLMGPLSGFSVVLIKLLIKLVQQGSDTLFVGELSNMVCSAAFIMSASVIYKKNKNKKGALLGMAVATVCVTIVGMLSNAYVMLPLYMSAYGMSMDDLISMCRAVNPAMDSVSGIIFWGTMPFNILKFSIVSLITFLIYKRIGRLLKRLME